MPDSKPPDAYKNFLQDIGNFSSEPEKGQQASPEEGDSASWEPMGQKIRLVRGKKGLTRQDIGRRTGLDEAYLEEVESDHIAPPLGVLIKIAKALDMRLGRFISTGKIKPFTVVRKGERKVISRFNSARGDRYGYTYESLAPDKKDRHMEPFMMTLVPSGSKKELSAHEGQEFIHVLKGALEVTLDDFNDVLYPGDSIYYDSNVPHLVRCHGDEETILLAVLYMEND